MPVRPLRFGDELAARSLREVSWPADALPAGAFAKIAELTSGRRIVVMPIDANEAVLAAKITGPGERATLSATLHDGMKAVTIRVNDVGGVAGFVLPGDHVDVVVSRPGDQNVAMSDVVLQNARVLAVDQLADQRADKPSVAKAVTLEVDVTEGEKLALASLVGTLSLMLRKAGEVTEANAAPGDAGGFGASERAIRRFTLRYHRRDSRDRSVRSTAFRSSARRMQSRSCQQRQRRTDRKLWTSEFGDVEQLEI